MSHQTISPEKLAIGLLAWIESRRGILPFAEWSDLKCQIDLLQGASAEDLFRCYLQCEQKYSDQWVILTGILNHAIC